jgi:hypothetical protein
MLRICWGCIVADMEANKMPRKCCSLLYLLALKRVPRSHFWVVGWLFFGGVCVCVGVCRYSKVLGCVHNQQGGQ